MEVKEKSKKRELIKTIAIIFLAVLLLLTFFSGTIMNHSLPEVATKLVSSGTINAKIRGSGTVAANESYEVELQQTREIRSVCVKVGDTVQEGDLLFVLGDIESEELRTAQETLQRLQIEYQTQILNNSKAYGSDNREVKELRETMEKAIADRDANQVTDEEVSYAKGDLASTQANLRQTEAIITELTALQTQNKEYEDAKAKVDELSDKVEDLEAELDKLESNRNSDAKDTLEDAERAYERAYTNWKSDWAAYESTIKQAADSGNISGFIWRGLPSSGVYSFTSSEQVAIEGYIRQQNLGGGGTLSTSEPVKTTSDLETAYSALIADQEDVEAKELAVERARQGVGSASDTVEEQIRTKERELSRAQEDLRAARQTLASLTQTPQLDEQVRTWESAKRQQEAAITELEAKVKDLEAKQEIYKTAVETIETTQRKLEAALADNDIDKQLNNLDLQSKSIEIQKQQELVEKYKKESVDTEILSKVSGVITSVNATSGKENDPSKPLATIDVVDRGYTVKISVTNDQAKQVKVGDTADVSNYYWGNDISAVLEQITPDPASGGKNKLLVFRITGDIDAGTNITLSIGQRSAEYSSIVPKSALREDTNGKFVLVVTSKNTPLGNRYTATRVDVQVLAEDDTSAAVSGLSQSDYVITTSSKPLDAGSQVRMVENPS